VSPASSRPAAAIWVPLALACVGALDLNAALAGEPAQTGLPAALLTANYLLVAFTGSLELTCAALIAMRRWLGRTLYRYLLPPAIMLGAAIAWLRYAGGLNADLADPARANAMLALGVAASIAIYAVVVIALYRPAMTAWIRPQGTMQSDPDNRDSTAPEDGE
jgi:hypothetical protein